MLTAGGLFSGIGGIESGYEKAGFKILWSNENDPYSARSFRHNYKHLKDNINELTYVYIYIIYHIDLATRQQAKQKKHPHDFLSSNSVYIYVYIYIAR